MKVTITDREVKEVKREYPYVGKYETLTVLFTSPKAGIILRDEDIDMGARYEVGYYTSVWSESLYTPLVNKTITIEV